MKKKQNDPNEIEPGDIVTVKTIKGKIYPSDCKALVGKRCIVRLHLDEKVVSDDGTVIVETEKKPRYRQYAVHISYLRLLEKDTRPRYVVFDRVHQIYGFIGWSVCDQKRQKIMASFNFADIRGEFRSKKLTLRDAEQYAEKLNAAPPQHTTPDNPAKS